MATFSSKIMTIERHTLEQQRFRPGATGALTLLLNDVATAAKIISREVRRAGLGDILGDEGTVNATGDEVKKLDIYADKAIYRVVDHTGRVCVMASEEQEEIIEIPERFASEEAKYVLMFDPLDGSSNIDCNASIGTIFSIHQRVSSGKQGTLEDCLQAGHKQVAAGYVIYGSSTVMVYTAGHGVHGFTLDPTLGEFLLAMEDAELIEKISTEIEQADGLIQRSVAGDVTVAFNKLTLLDQLFHTVASPAVTYLLFLAGMSMLLLDFEYPSSK